MDRRGLLDAVPRGHDGLSGAGGLLLDGIDLLEPGDGRPEVDPRTAAEPKLPAVGLDQKQPKPIGRHDVANAPWRLVEDDPRCGEVWWRRDTRHQPAELVHGEYLDRHARLIHP